MPDPCPTFSVSSDPTVAVFGISLTAVFYSLAADMTALPTVVVTGISLTAVGYIFLLSV